MVKKTDKTKAKTSAANGKLGGRPGFLVARVKTAIDIEQATLDEADRIAALRGVKRAAVLRDWIEAGKQADPAASR
jgi:hypothetical protein